MKGIRLLKSIVVPGAVALLFTGGAMTPAGSESRGSAHSAPPAASRRTGAEARRSDSPSQGAARARVITARSPLSFEPNLGQAPQGVQFLSRGSGYTLSLTGDEAILELLPSSAVIRTRLLNHAEGLQPVGENIQPCKSNYYIGNDPRKWRTNIPNYGRVRYRDVYPGVDLAYYGKQGQLEYDFAVSAGADPHRIGLEMTGARSVSVSPAGDLLLHVAGGDVTWQKPLAYQWIDGQRRSVSCRYAVETRARSAAAHPGAQRVRFALGSYDRSQPLVIDPLFAYSSYLIVGGSCAGQGIALDAQGNAYITGSALSVGLSKPSSASSVFVAGINANGSLKYRTYFGGSGVDYGYGIAADANGSAYITGWTYSSDFPVSGGLQSTNKAAANGNSTAFVAKVGSGGSVDYSTYLGGSVGDGGNAIAVDSLGDAYVTGYTESPDFPLQAAIQGALGGPGAANVFVAKLGPGGSNLIYSTYLGGENDDEGMGIALDPANDAYVTGYATSPDFPVASALQGSLNGNQNFFVTEFDATGGLIYSTFLGGSGPEGDAGGAIAVDSDGDAYVTGWSTSMDFPTKNAIQGPFSVPDNGHSVVVAELKAGGDKLVYSTYLGADGTYGQNGNGIAVDATGNTYVTGWTDASVFPVTGGEQSLAGHQNAFVTEILAGGGSVVYSTCLGGSQYDAGNGIAVDSSGNAFVTGYTNSPDFPIQNAFDSTYQPSGQNAFVTKLNSQATGVPTTTSLSSSPDPVAVGHNFTLKATVTGQDGGIPTGAVAFTAGGVTLGTAPLVNQTASLTLKYSTAMVLMITAQYGGDATYDPSISNVITQVIGALPTTTSLVTSLTPSYVYQPITLTATVTSAFLTPAGTVTFKNGSSTLSGGSVTYSSAGNSLIATWSGSLHAAATYSITAYYSGSGEFDPSFSSLLTQQVNPAPASIAVTVSPASPTYGQAFSYKATVTGMYGGSPTGTVTVSLTGAPQVSGTLAANHTTTIPAAGAQPDAGSTSCSAKYTGDFNFSSSTTNFSVTVKKATTTTVLTSSPSSPIVGQTVTFTAAVASKYGAFPGGSVTFHDSNAMPGTQQGIISYAPGPSGGFTATATWTFATAGTHVMTAAYSGNTDNDSSTGTLHQIIGKQPTTTTLGSSLNPSVVHQTVTLTATVTAAMGTLTGTVTFQSGGANLTGGTVVYSNPMAGELVATWTGFFTAAGSYTLTANYNGAANFAASTSAAIAQTVNQDSTTTVITSSLNPAFVGQASTFTISVVSAHGGIPTGTVDLTPLGSSPVPLTLNSAGKVTYGPTTYAGASSNGYQYTASYVGSADFLPSTSQTLIQVVNPAPTSTTLQSSPNPEVGQTVVLTAAVSGKYGQFPTGMVTFMDGSTVLGSAPLQLNLAVFPVATDTSVLPVTFTTVGTHSLSATYSGDSNFLTSTGTLHLMVAKETTTTVLSSSVNPATVNQSVTFTATVSAAMGSPTGTVTFVDGATTLGSSSIAGGAAVLTKAFTTTGAHLITANYNGSTSYAGSASAQLSQSVLQATTTALTSSPNPSVVNQKYTLTATVAPTAGGGVPTGTVAFMFGSPPLTAGTSTLVGGVATFTIASSNPGNISWGAIYSGDSNFAASTGSVTQVVNAAPSTTTLQSSLNPAAAGQSVTLTAAVTSEFGAYTSGTVTFMDGAVTLGTASVLPQPVGPHTATLSVTFTTVGSHSLTAIYSGDVNNLASTSTTLSQTVN